MEKKTKKTKSTPKPKEISLPPKSKKLVRSVNDRVIAGVCAGIANYFELDPIIVRILFLIVAFTAGSGFLIYIILWIVIPEAGDEHLSTEEITKKNSKELEQKFETTVEKIDTGKSNKVLRVLFGLGIMFFGFYLVLENLGLGHIIRAFWSIGKLWPVIIIFFGFYILLKKND